MTPPVTTPTPVNPAEPWTTLPEGIVPRALVQEVKVATPDPPLLACAKPGGRTGFDHCGIAGQILGFKADGVLLIFPPESGHPDIWPLVGEVVGLDGTSHQRTVVTQIGELENREYRAAQKKGWAWLAAQARAGYKPPEPLLWALGATGSYEAETWQVPLAFLKAPLAGWMLHVDIPAVGDEMVLQLVTPDNQTAHRLATLPVPTAGHCRDQNGDLIACARPRRLGMVFIDAVALNPARTHLVVLFTMHTTGASDSTLRGVYPLPDGVRPEP